MKRWVYEVIEGDDGKIRMNRDNDGFGLFELLGFCEVLRSDLLDFLRGGTHVDQIRRVATSNSPGVPPEGMEAKE